MKRSANIENPALPLLIFLAALLYSSVGHGGASGYLAAMALVGVAPEAMKPVALSLNILVSSIALARFHRVNAFQWKLFWPFAATSIPMAFAGGMLSLSAGAYKSLVGAVLVFAAIQMFRAASGQPVHEPKPPVVPVALGAGAGIGFLSGATGVGGGIFLSPLLILAGWATARNTAGVSAAFILSNSASGLLGHWASIRYIPEQIWILAAAAVAGGLIGSTVGSRKLSNALLRRTLAVVLAVAGLKFIIG